MRQSVLSSRRVRRHSVSTIPTFFFLFSLMALVSISHFSSSEATAESGFSYDVFLSFRGETRKNFADHLYTALKQAGTRVFRDNAMERGKLLGPELKKVIHRSAISLFVFSKDYASSEWCLNEVLISVQVQETISSKHEVVPVFYKVEPSDVRDQTGSFKKVFDKYDKEIEAEKDLEKKRESSEKVKAWKKALRKAATFSGMVLGDGYESTFIRDIVNVVIKKIDNKALHIDEKLVGIEGHVAEIRSWLQDPSPNSVILLIVGKGGIGKTTIAKCIFNLHFRDYEASCFLADINEASNQPGGLRRLQSQLLSTILSSDKEETIWNVDEGTVKVTRAISNKEVFLILDDVATRKQLEALLGPKMFYLGSKVIITTRHTSLLSAFREGARVHSVGALTTADATELFSFHAFHQNQPMEPYIVLTKAVVDCCKGLPLALKVWGLSIREMTMDVWKDKMRKLERIPPPEIKEILQINYESLAVDSDKDIFLHISCALEGEKEGYIVKFFGESVVSIMNLIDRSLLSNTWLFTIFGCVLLAAFLYLLLNLERAILEEELVGMEDYVAKIESWLQDPSPDALVLVIDGLSGIGKTTIAKCIFNLHFRDYDASCFLADINEASNQPGGLLRLQSQLFSKILTSGKKETVRYANEKTFMDTREIFNKKVLLILDDVATREQVDALLGPQNFYPGSKVIITTRQRWLMSAFRDGATVHRVDILSTADATELFSLHAFHLHQPIEPYISQSQLFVNYCMGHPLALKVLGSFLHGKTTDEWEGTMHKLAPIHANGISELLQMIYESFTDDNDKEIFLQISCALEGEKKGYIVKLLGECGLDPVVGIKNLIDRGLIYVDGYGRVRMHRLIKEIGRQEMGLREMARRFALENASN